MTRLRALGPAALAVLLAGCTDAVDLGSLASEVKSIRTSADDPPAPALEVQVVERKPAPLADTETPPAPAQATALKPPTGSAAVQLGAFRDEAAARAAWNRLRDRHALGDLQPRFERIDRPSGALVRLKAGPLASSDEARALCAKLGVADPWCAKGSFAGPA